jgi:5'-nucleotidase
MRIQVSNDDGIYSPGILALAEVAGKFGEVRIVAPEVEQSSMGHAITSNRPLRYRRVPIKSFDAYGVNGTPGDCVALGLHLFGGADLVVSGINHGLNLGNSIWHSGTVAAAKQAVLLGRRGMAFSTPAEDIEPDFEALKPAVEEVLGLLIDRPSPMLINVNLPARSRGILWTRQSVRQYDGKIMRNEDPNHREHYWFTVVPIQNPEEGTDRWALEHGLTSITPLRLDLTDYSELENIKPDILKQSHSR